MIKNNLQKNRFIYISRELNTSREILNPESGQAVLIAVILSLAVSMMILFGLSLPIADQIKNSNDYVASKQALIDARTWPEEMLYRLNQKKNTPSILSMSTFNDAASVSISDVDVSTKQIISNGAFGLFKRKIKAIIKSNSDVDFNNGAWLSSGGLRMDNSSRINGDVFSLGNRLMLNSSAITGAFSTSSTAVNMPISDDTINNWITQASSEQIINSSVTISGTATSTVGALKINGDLTIKTSGTLTLNGPLYVTGNLSLNNSSKILLGSGYGPKSETIVVGGTIDIQQSAYVGGSGQAGSTVILVSKSTAGCSDTSCTSISPAINVVNSAIASAILVAPHGAVYLSNSADAKGVLANYLYMANSSTITHDPMLYNIIFNSSTSTFWSITSLGEI